MFNALSESNHQWHWMLGIKKEVDKCAYEIKIAEKDYKRSFDTWQDLIKSGNPLAHLNHSNLPVQSTITVLVPLAHLTNFKTVPILTCTHLVLLKIQQSSQIRHDHFAQ
ncbi:hypothetical protein DID88_002140 [Monilinia fructigena]|uniref:Uncharacterized protein n=1 Tax=Monilinia fructigena TaxID=38457 RepID=A0A395IWZ7_9HELO|nr:hypothetical protein DID88_002140 [Monilinia fructigena]